MIEHFSLRLVDSRMLAPSVRHLTFERADGQALAYHPGQFLHVHCRQADGSPAKRSFSIANVGPAGAGESRRIELVTSYVPGGLATGLLGELKPGDCIEASGPSGRFHFMDGDANARYLLLATGTGVAPYRAMLPWMERLMDERDCRFVLLHGARNEEELLFGEQFDAFAERHPRFAYHPCLSRAPRAQPRAYDRRGHVQDVLPELDVDPARDIAYLCGNPDMVDQGFAALKQAGLGIRDIRREKYVSSR